MLPSFPCLYSCYMHVNTLVGRSASGRPRHQKFTSIHSICLSMWRAGIIREENICRSVPFLLPRHRVTSMRLMSLLAKVGSGPRFVSVTNDMYACGQSPENECPVFQVSCGPYDASIVNSIGHFKTYFVTTSVRPKRMVFKDSDTFIPDQINLPKERQQALTEMADRVVAETLCAYEHFIANNRQLDSRLWKHVKSREKVHVYRTRRSGSKRLNLMNEKRPSRPRLLSINTIEQQQHQANMAGRPHGFTPDEEDEEPEQAVENSSSNHSQTQQSTYTQSSSSDCGSFSVFPDESVLEKVKPTNIPLVAAVGSIDGSVEDVAFGALAHTDEAWFERNAYVKNDGFVCRKVLASFQSPSEEDPFRYVGIKWATLDITTFASRRDVVFLESSGIALDSDGERVYYSLAHSIELDECPVPPDRFNIVRLNLSICYIMRQISDTKIDAYARGYADMGGNLPAVIGLNVFSQGVVDVVGIVEASYLKKLAWQLSRRGPSDTSSHQTKECSVCGKNAKKIASLIQRATCAICRHTICQKCSVHKKLLVKAEEDLQRQFTFCVPCVIEARRMSAWDVATAQLKCKQRKE